MYKRQSLTREESNRLFCEVEKDYLDIKSKLKRFKEIRENPHFNAVQVKFAYAVTCHKAQEMCIRDRPIPLRLSTGYSSGGKR